MKKTTRRKDTPTKTPTERPANKVAKIGRPATGKRSNPDFRQVSAWVRRDTYERVTNRLFLKEGRREFSELVQELLDEWLRRQQTSGQSRRRA